MYERHFGFREKPFSLQPDPGFIYLGEKHGLAYSMLEYGILNQAGIILITGEIGSGKTTLVRHLLNQLDDSCVVGLISNTHHSFGSLIQWISDAFDLPNAMPDEVALYRQFVDFLIREYAKGNRAVLIIDEAQNMSRPTLEELRVISNINADKNLVLQIVLVGQPELRATLRGSDMRQLAQRLGADFHLSAMGMSDTTEYIRHRLTVAGGNPAMFDPDALKIIWQESGGVPRLVNALCDQSLVCAYAESSATVSASLIEEVMEERRKLGALGFADSLAHHDSTDPTDS